MPSISPPGPWSATCCSTWMKHWRNGESMRSAKGSRRITVQGVEYRWRARGDDGYMSIGIWPTNSLGPFIRGDLRYHATWTENGDGSSSSAGHQIIVTNRLIKLIIEHAISTHGYDPHNKSKELNLQVLDDEIKWEDAVRATD